MIKPYTLIVILLFTATFCNNRALAQDKIADSTQLRQTTVNMAAMFNKAVVEQSGLYNGPAFIPYSFRSATNANFHDTTGFANGNVNYDGIVYKNVPLIYNINRDMVVSRLYNGFSIYTLISDKVSDFDLFNHHFIMLYPDSLNSKMDAGFYDELYHNKLQVLARRTKEIQRESISTGTGTSFYELTDYFLKKGGKYYNVNSQGKFFDVLKDKKKELKQYIKDNKIRYKDNPEHVMAALAAYYDHLTN